MVNIGSGHRGLSTRGLVLGAVVGAALGLLLAPKSGREIREDLKEQSGALRARAGGLTTSVRRRVGTAAEGVRHRIRPAAEVDPIVGGDGGSEDTEKAWAA